METNEFMGLPEMPNDGMGDDKAYISKYHEACEMGPRTYVPYAEILHAIADGKRVEWQDGLGNWVYQHPSHTLNEIKHILGEPERYRVVELH